MEPATTAAAKISLFEVRIESLLPSVRNFLEISSIAQSLDGYGRLMGSLQCPQQTEPSAIFDGPQVLKRRDRLSRERRLLSSKSAE